MEVFRGGGGFVDSSEDGIYWQVAGYRGDAAGVDGALCNWEMGTRARWLEEYLGRT